MRELDTIQCQVGCEGREQPTSPLIQTGKHRASQTGQQHVPKTASPMQKTKGNATQRHRPNDADVCAEQWDGYTTVKSFFDQRSKQNVGNEKQADVAGNGWQHGSWGDVVTDGALQSFEPG